jgi:DNA polymerase III epsilon subunit-like protein
MKAFIFDTETTGLIQNRVVKLELQPEVIEFYGCLVDLKKGKVIKELETVIKPRLVEKLPPKITQITRLTDEDLSDAPSFLDMAPEILPLLEEAPLVIAHNLAFDKDMIDIECERIDRKVTWPRGLCTVEQSMHYRGKRLTLAILYEHLFEESFPDAHRARNDVEALTRVSMEMFRRGDLK